MIKLTWVGAVSLALTADAVSVESGAMIDFSFDCDSTLVAASVLNAHDLWAGSELCWRQQRVSDSTFLLLAGQLRASTDIELLEPVEGSDEVKVGELAATMFYAAGGSGDDEVFRDPVALGWMIERLRGWEVDFGPEYDPGWSFESSVGADQYQSVLRCNLELRLRQLHWYAQLVQDDEFRVLSEQRGHLIKQAEGPFEAGTDLSNEMGSLQREIDRVAERYPQPEGNTPECEGHRSIGPSIDADFVQIMAGGNGPETKGLDLFESESEFLGSSVADLLTEDQRMRVLLEVDFDKSVLFLVSVGARKNVTSIHLHDVSTNDEFESVSVALMIGVNESDCDEPFVDSYPFLIGSFPGSADHGFRSTGHFLQNFGDGCGPALGADSPFIFGDWDQSDSE